MLYFDGLGGLIALALWIFCFIDVLVTPDNACRNLPKLAWVFIVLLIPPIGPIAWLIAGHSWNRSGAAPQGRAPIWQSAGRPGSRYTPQARGSRVPSNPDDDEEFLAGLRKRAEEQRERAREQQDKDRPDGDAG